jgi:hypothetical protein
LRFLTKQAYSGRVRADIDHNTYKPAAWRVDDYLKLDADSDDDDITGHVLAFAGQPRDEMARNDDVDNLVVRLSASSRQDMASGR